MLCLKFQNLQKSPTKTWDFKNGREWPQVPDVTYFSHKKIYPL